LRPPAAAAAVTPEPARKRKAEQCTGNSTEAGDGNDAVAQWTTPRSLPVGHSRSGSSRCVSFAGLSDRDDDASLTATPELLAIARGKAAPKRGRARAHAKSKTQQRVELAAVRAMVEGLDDFELQVERGL
jgi:hypothetical protein